MVSDSFIINALIANIKTCSQIYEKFPLMFRKLKQKGLNQKIKILLSICNWCLTLFMTDSLGLQPL